MRIAGGLLCNLFLILLVAVFLLLSAGLSRTGRSLVMPVAALTLVFCLIETFRDVARSPASPVVGKSSAGRSRQENIVLVWFFGCVGAIYVLGFGLAAPLFLLFYLRKVAGLRWKTAVLASVSLAVVLVALLDAGLETSLYRGAVWAWMGL